MARTKTTDRALYPRYRAPWPRTSSAGIRVARPEEATPWWSYFSGSYNGEGHPPRWPFGRRGSA